jgi:broad specificity phosphatase PhoE
MRTTVHLLRHGEVYNPDGILYGRRGGYHLSDLGTQMAERVADRIGDRDIVRIVSSPLERAQETAAPLARRRGLELVTDERVIESTNIFEGRPFSLRNGIFRRPSTWKHLWNPLRPSWGEPYRDIATRMWEAVEDARDRAAGHETVVVSHQLPIWITRLFAEQRRFLHDPRRRQCTLCSLTSFTFADERLATISYAEPAGDLIPVGDRRAAFSAGGAAEEDKPIS